MKIISFILLIYLALTSSASSEESEFITLATTTSTENSGILTALNEQFTKDTGINVHVVAKGTGASLKLAEKGDADIVMVHCPDLEEKFVSDGYGTRRYPFMYNDFILIGPKNDPAGAEGSEIREAMKTIARKKETFISRCDRSGTHMKEMSLWKLINVSPEGDWRLCVGQGMGKTIMITFEKAGYTLSDRGTYLAFRKKNDLIIISEDSELLHNPYSIIPVNPKKHEHVKYENAKRYAEWIVSDKAQRIIADFRVKGEPLFFPDARSHCSEKR